MGVAASEQGSPALLGNRVAVELLDSRSLARLAYTSTDGTPRVAVTIDDPSFPPHVLLIRGDASVELLDDITPECFLRRSGASAGDRPKGSRSDRWRGSR